MGLEIPAWWWFPPIVLPSPVMALASGLGGVWAGGVGGVAWRAAGGEWEPRVSGLPLTRVAALAYAGGWLLAGGAEGIARSEDGGGTWQRAEVRGGAARVATIVTSPRMAEDATALAATVGDGILRTSDAGRTWELANFGLQDLEVTALAWGTGESVLAGTAGGIYRSPNGGRAWRAARGSEELAVAALTWLPDGTAIAVLEDGSLLRSSDGGARWAPFGALPAGTLATALMTSRAGVLLGTASHGLLESSDGGETWAQIAAGEVLSLAADQATLYAGTADGLLASAGGVDWRASPVPPIHDLRRLMIVGSAPLVAGAYSGLVRYHPSSGWEALASAPAPLSGLAAAPDGALCAAGLDGLARSIDAGTTWQIVVPGESGWVEHLTFGADGLGWAGSADGSRLLRTQDDGATWEACAPPFGVLRLAALQATSGTLIAVTYEPQLQLAQPWRSFDGGQVWERGAQVHTAWPIVATCATPALFALGDTVYAQRPDGDWGKSPIGASGMVRRIVGASGTLLALTTAGVYRSLDQGITWTRWDEQLPIDQIMDLAVADGKVYALLAGGQLCSGSL